mmetsp:Transcript_15948/g.33309  ORF Transcript_15948/g.33309 Transcript_15948/m.33309 type:complete len:210 (-) Transcript_15948:4-633(-)
MMFTISPCPLRKPHPTKLRLHRRQRGRQTRIIRPPSSVSVAMPAQRLPATPPASNIEAIAPALAADMPTREVKKVGSQSIRQYRAIFTSMYDEQSGKTPLSVAISATPGPSSLAVVDPALIAPLVGKALEALLGSTASMSGENIATTTPDSTNTERQPLDPSTALAKLFAAMPPLCCEVCHSPTTLARIDAGNVSAIKITRRGLRQAAE